MSKEKVIQVDVEKLKELFSKFNQPYSMYGLLSIHHSLEYNLDEQKFYTLSEKIQQTKEKIISVNNTLLEIKKMLISAGCLLD